MPMSRISLLKGRPPAYLKALSDSLQQALEQAFDVPAGDRFQVIHQLEANELIFDRNYLSPDGPRSDDFVLINITAGRVRPTAVKQAFYRQLVALLAQAPGIAPRDVMVVINTTQSDDWSFGGGADGIGRPPAPGSNEGAST